MEGLAGLAESVLAATGGARFNTFAFLLVFFPVVLAGYWILRGRRVRLAWLTAASLVFYSLYDVRFTALLVVAAAADFGFALALARSPGPRRKWWLACSVLFNLGLLFVFKYLAFAVDSAIRLAGWMGVDLGLVVPAIVLPVGISFFTFKTLSYTLDVYRGEVPATRDFLQFLAFVSLFPELVAGPIVRYRSLGRQLADLPQRLPSVMAVGGLSLFGIGLFKKVAVADSLALWVDPLWALPDPSMAQAWGAALGYTLQLYFDFSGYSDMAIGIAALLGLRFPVNFRAPYQARSPADFWHRWHITLSTFLRDYLYIPLGGSRGGPGRTTANLMVVMLLGGLWHGAAWHFLAWGAYHGVLLVAHRSIADPWARLPVTVQRGLTFLLVVVGWVLFRAPSLRVARDFLEAMFVPNTQWLAGADILLAIGIVAGLLWVWAARPTSDRAFAPTWRWAATLGVMMGCTFILMGRGTSPFLYYQF